MSLQETIATNSHSRFSLIQENISLADKNWFRTGGLARYYAAPRTIAEFQEALSFAHAHILPIFVLGKGANILISDEGFKGLVIHPQLLEICTKEVDENTIILKAGSGVAMEDLIIYCLNNNIIGLEEFSGIPGTVGGSVYINLHYFEFLLDQFLIEAEVIHKETREIQTVTTDWFQFGYNQSTLQKHEHYLISATFKLKRCTQLEAAYAKGRSIEIARHRAKRYPVSHTCGSFFRNFHPHEVTLESNGKKMIFVAYYLDKIGVKGALQIGDAIVSHQHANMLVNRGNATSSDLINLARTMQELVHKQFGIIPKPECLLIGFEKYPLL
ncbi:MAG TPA: UDP-N-acetylmuramate dehydrogenase [Candidatus Babeliales bacterium]|nr:UDP-N-acetylmuramate dehydrogenase [Candidatus Babeliales bacterium]